MYIHLLQPHEWFIWKKMKMNLWFIVVIIVSTKVRETRYKYNKNSKLSALQKDKCDGMRNETILYSCNTNCLNIDHTRENSKNETRKLVAWITNKSRRVYYNKGHVIYIYIYIYIYIIRKKLWEVVKPTLVYKLFH